MKIRFHIMPLVAMIALLSACDKDNYLAPKSTLSGRIVYNGEPIGVEYDQVRLQLWQPGFGKLAAIDAPIAQDGSYSALLFDGSYKLVFPRNRGPFKTIVKDAAARDTLFVSLNGNQKLDVEVTPYYMIRTPQFSGGESKVSATVKLEKVLTGTEGKDIERVSLYVNKTDFVSRATNVAVTDLPGAEVKDLNAVSLTATVPTLSPAQKYVFARVGVKIKDVEDMVFTPVQKVDL